MQGNANNPGQKLKEKKDLEMSQVSERLKTKRHLAAQNALNDQTLRSIYHQNDTTRISTDRLPTHVTRNHEYIDAKINDMLNKTSNVQSQIFDMSKLTSRRIKELKNQDRDLRPITDKDLLMTKPPANLLEYEIREDYQKMEEENIELLKKKQSLIESMLTGQTQATAQFVTPRTDGGQPMQADVPQRNIPSYYPSPPKKIPALPVPTGEQWMGLKQEKKRELELKFREQQNKIMAMNMENEDLERRLKDKKAVMQSLPNAPPMHRPVMPAKPGQEKQKLIQNSKRNSDLNDFERALVFVEAQENDAIDLMMNVPVGTDLYRFKAEQFKETSTTRGEIEKLVYEQMLKAMKKGYDIESKEAERRSENLMWDDEQRKNILAGYIRRQLGTGLALEYNSPYVPEESEEEEKEEIPPRRPEKRKTYDPAEGFIVYWDYCLGLPQYQRQTAFEFQIVSQGEIIRDLEQSADIGRNVEESNTTCRSIFGLKNRIKNIPINPETLLIWKVYMPHQEGDRETFTEIGWTQIDLWTLSRNLKRGRWKCPLYKLPVDTNITKQGVQELTPIPGEWFYLRISYPWQDEFNRGSLIPEESSQDAEIPEIHLRAARMAPPPIALPPVIEVVPDKPPELPTDPVDRDQNRKKTPPPPKEDVYKPPDQNLDAKPPKEEIKIGDRVGVIIEINKVIARTAKSHMRVGVSCRERGIKVKDDTLYQWERQTMIHNPFLKKGNEEEEFETAIVESQLVKEGKMANLAQGFDIIFNNQKFNLFRNLKAMMKQTQTHVYLIFQLLEKPEPKDVLRGKNKGFGRDQMANLGGLQYNVIGLAVFRLSTEEMNIREGQQTIPFYKPETVLLPEGNEEINEALWKPVDDGTMLDFRITLKPYTPVDVKTEYQKFQVDRSKKPEPAIKPELASLLNTVHNIVRDDPLIKNAKKQYPNNVFEKGWGIDFYLDQCRFLPDNVSITKVYIYILDVKCKDVFQPLATMSTKLTNDNDAFCPVFNFRHEYRKEFIDPTSLIFLSFVTIDASNNQPRIIGHAAHPLFLNRRTQEQAADPNDTEVVLKSGAYQLQIKSEEPLRKFPFNKEKINKLENLPCASVLIRVRLAPFKDDMKTVLGKNDVPKAEWVSKGIWPPRPDYRTGEYNSDDIKPRAAEMKLFGLRAQRAPISLSQRAAELKAKNGKENEEMNARGLWEFIEGLIEYTPKTNFLDGKYFAKYLPESGFELVIDGVHNVPSENPFITYYSMNPPGSFYQDSNQTDDLHMMAKITWEHPIGQIKYHSDYLSYTGMEFDIHKHVIIEVKELVFTKEEVFEFKDFAWTAIPIFIGNGYVNGAHYQIPLFRGAFPKDLLLKELREKPVWETIEKLRSSGKISWTSSYSSILLRIRDGQRQGQLKVALDFKTLDFTYLPLDIDERRDFAYNQQVKEQLDKKKKLKQAVTGGRNSNDYNKEIEIACVEKYNLKNYALGNEED
jgi:hypothetical protein